MGLRINNPLLTLRAANGLQKTQKAIARSLERLSTGQRVNSPRDDAHAFLEGVGLTAQIRGLTQSTLGINSALGMIDTADSAVSTQLDIVQRMRELALEASNGTLSSLERSNLNDEVQSLLDEYNRITTSTDFNGTKLLDGTFSTVSLLAGSTKRDSIGFTIGSTQASSVFIQRTTVGNGTFQARTTIQVGQGSGNLITADLNGDGNPDLLSSDQDSLTMSIALGNGNGTFKPVSQIIPDDAGNLVVGDVNHDGVADIVFNAPNLNEFEVYLGNGNGTFQSPTTFGSTELILSHVLTDINGDGRLDIVGTSTGNTVDVYLGNGNGTFQTMTTSTSGTFAIALTTADINGDGKMDVINVNDSSSTLSISLGNGNGTFQTRTTITTGATPVQVLAADLNGDGKVDLISADSASSTISYFLGNGNGTFQTRKTLGGLNAVSALNVVDLNGDGKLDFTYGDGQGMFAYFLGNGNGTFGSRMTLPADFYTNSTAAADVNGDGVPDFIGIENDSDGSGYGDFAIYLGNSTQTSAVASVRIDTQAKAEAMLQVFDDAIKNLDTTRSNLAAIHSRLNVTVSYNLMLSENLQDARSRALDTDYVLEVADLAKNQILGDMQLAALTQANLNKQLVLKLFQNL